MHSQRLFRHQLLLTLLQESVHELMMAALSLDTPATGNDENDTHTCSASQLDANSNPESLPFLAALPKLGQVQGLHNFPEEYLPLINNEPMVRRGCVQRSIECKTAVSQAVLVIGDHPDVGQMIALYMTCHKCWAWIC